MSDVVMDFLAAWEFVLKTNPVDHHAKCSFRTHQMLCDCDVLNNEYERRRRAT